MNGNRATEIERSSSRKQIEKAIERLIESGKSEKELRVSQENLDRAKDIAKDMDAPKMTISNLGGTRRRFVR